MYEVEGGHDNKLSNAWIPRGKVGQSLWVLLDYCGY